MAKQIINPPELAPPRSYAHVVKAGNTVYVAGQVAWSKDGQIVGENDFAAQAEQVFENLRICLQAAGASFTDVVKMTTYVTDASNIVKLREIRKKYFGEHTAASTAVGVTGLAMPGLLIEVEVIAEIE